MAGKQFALHQPESLDEALNLLAAHRASVKVLAGGTDLVPKLKAGVLNVQHLVSLKRVAALEGVSFDPRQGLSIGGGALLAEVAAVPEVKRFYPGLAHACSVMATTQIRNMGTVAGNLANAAPSADTAAPLLVYDASLAVVGVEGRREIALADFFLGPGLGALSPLEIIEAIKLPAPAYPEGSVYERLSARSRVDIAAVGVAGLLGLDGQGRVSRCRLALASVAPTPLRCRQVEHMLEGQVPGDDFLDRAAEAAAGACQPIDDVRSSAAYRRTMVRVLSRRVLGRCLGLAQGGA